MDKKFIYIILLALIVLAWSVAGQSSKTSLLISNPSAILQFMQDNWSSLLSATMTTLIESFLGLFIATVLSMGTMIVCLFYPKLLDVVLPIFITSQVIPLITLAPFFIILFGIGMTAKVMMSALLCFFPIFVNFNNGIKQIGQEVHELMFVYDASTTQKIKDIYLPLSTPDIMAGLKISATLSVIGAIVAEFNGAEVGLGKNLFLAAKRLEPELMMSSLLLSAVLGGLLYGTILLIEKRIGKWYLT